MFSSNSTFTRCQLDQYFDHIELPAKYRAPTSRLDVNYLAALHIHHISTIPYENLALHYSPTRTISLKPEDLFNKFVTKECNRGGYCLENSLFFTYILRSLGFDAYPTGARIRLREDGVPKGDYIGLVHIVNIVTFSTGEKYVCDSAFGGDGPTRPLPLISGQITLNLGSQQVRLVYSPITQVPARPSGHQKFWIYQYRNSEIAEWNSFYCFTETEFMTQDFDVMNFFTSEGNTFQRTMVLIVKFLRDNSKGRESKVEDSRIVGKILLVNGTVKRNLGGKTEIVQVCKNEDERIKALKHWFGISVTDEERQGIKGLVTELQEKEFL